MGDVVMIADGQWAVPVTSRAESSQDDVTQARLRDGRRVELTVEELARAVEELARAVGAADPGAHRGQAEN